MSQTKTNNTPKNNNQGTETPFLRILPLGGLGEIGKNMMVVEYGADIIIIDVGLMFPTADMHGVDVVIPDIEYLLDRLDNVKAIFLSHGHEDHIGGLPYMIEEGLKAPVYATALTRGLLEGKLRENRLLGEVKLNTITADSKVEVGVFTVEFFHTCHSFPDSVGLSIQTPIGRIIHTSDYKFDPSPADGKLTETVKLEKWGDEGVLLLMADSTNAENPGTTPSEASLEASLDKIFAEAPGRVLLSTFASNVSRVQQIINAARKNGRKIGVTGRSMVNNVKIAGTLGYLDVTQDELLNAHEMENMPGEKVVVVSTGSQGEPTSAMVRMSMGEHRQIKLRQGDTVVISASPIPGNEELFNRTIDNLFRQGVEVVYHALAHIHVSGHGNRDEYARMLQLVRPRFFIPAHGEYRHLVLHARLAEENDVAKENIFAVTDGQMVEIGNFDTQNPQHIQARLGERIPAPHVLVDGLGVGDVGSVVLRDRGHLAEDGFIVCIVAMDEFDKEVIYGPEIISRGFVYMRDSEDLIERAEEAVRKAVKKGGPTHVIEKKVRESLSSFTYKEMGRRPMILPMVIEV